MGISTLALVLMVQIGAPHIEHVRTDTTDQWSVSAEAGAGQLGDAAAMWTQPRFTLHRNQIDVVLSLPLSQTSLDLSLGCHVLLAGVKVAGVVFAAGVRVAGVVFAAVWCLGFPVPLFSRVMN